MIAVDPYTPDVLIYMLRGFALRIEANSHGPFSDQAAHRVLAAINEECRKMLAVLDRPDLLAEFDITIPPSRVASDEEGTT